MLLNLIIFTLIMGFFIAKVEINVEGAEGMWAKNLPTWKVKNRFTRIAFGEKPLTGYHIWFCLMGFFFLHFPYFVGLPFSFQFELQLMAVFIWGVVVEDFYWFLLNPAFGLKRFNPQVVTWHEWIWIFPRFYWTYLITGCAVLLLSYYL